MSASDNISQSEKSKNNDKKTKPSRKGFWLNVLKASVAFILFGVLFAAIAFYYILDHYGRDLPDYQQLADYEPPIISRVYAAGR